MLPEMCFIVGEGGGGEGVPHGLDRDITLRSTVLRSFEKGQASLLFFEGSVHLRLGIYH